VFVVAGGVESVKQGDRAAAQARPGEEQVPLAMFVAMIEPPAPAAVCIFLAELNRRPHRCRRRPSSLCPRAA
jgi:hypothetical protein